MFKSNFFKMTALLAVFKFAINANIFAQTYTINPSKSKVEWEGSKSFVPGSHNGTIDIKEGSVVKNGNSFTGKFVLDMNTIKSDDVKDSGLNAKLVGHLKSDDFFNVEQYPTSTFEITKIEPKTDKSGKTNHTVSGKLTIRNITKDFSFPAMITFNGKDMTAKAEFTIDRSKWEVKYGSGSFFDNLGDKTISNDIKYVLNIVGNSK